MPRKTALFCIRMVGRPEHPRYVIRDARRLADHLFTGRGWSHRLRDARLYHDPDDVNRTVARLTRRHLRRHKPKHIYLMTLVVRAYAEEDVGKGDVERYLRDALIVGVDHNRHGTGPTPDSLVEVCVPVISLEDGR